MRNGAESAVYINTAQEFDGSDAGARPDEAVSWGKIKVGAESVKVSSLHFTISRRYRTSGCQRKINLLTKVQVYVEATACFPLIVAATFAKDACSSTRP